MTWRAKTRPLFGQIAPRRWTGIRRWDQVLDDSNKPFYKWFVGGKTNMALNALDRHVTTWRRNKLALIWEGEDGEKVSLSYWRLWQEVNKFANVLRSMGVKKGDRVTIYMGRVPEIAIAMLACAKVGAPHSVVYGGFSEQALASRIEDAQSKVLITCDGAWLRGKIVRLKDTVDEAVQRSPVVETVIVVKRTGHDIGMEPGRDYWYHDLMALPIASTQAETEVMDAEDPLFILYTSGTTGKPKGVLHTHGGYQVYTATTLEWAFDHQRGRPLVVRGRSWLDHRAQLHRLRAADSGRDQHHLRRRADLPLPGPLVEDRGRLRRVDIVHSAYGHPRL